MQTVIIIRHGSDSYLTEYKNLAKTQSASVVLYLLEPTMNSGYQNLLVVRRYDIGDPPKPKVMDIKVTKKWEDNNNSAGKRPNSININLYANEELYTTATMTGDMKANEWSYTFTEIPETINKKEIQYYVEEEVPDGYIMTQQNIYE